MRVGVFVFIGCMTRTFYVPPSLFSSSLTPTPTIHKTQNRVKDVLAGARTPPTAILLANIVGSFPELGPTLQFFRCVVVCCVCSIYVRGCLTWVKRQPVLIVSSNTKTHHNSEAFDPQQAKRDGIIKPLPGVDPQYDDVSPPSLCLFFVYTCM